MGKRGTSAISDYGGYGQYVSLVIAPDGTPYAGYMQRGAALSADKAAVRQFDGTAWSAVGGAGMVGIEGVEAWTSLPRRMVPYILPTTISSLAVQP